MVTGKWFPHPIDEPEFFAFVTGWREVEEADHHLLPAEVVVLVGVQDPEQVSRIFCRVTWNNKNYGSGPLKYYLGTTRKVLIRKVLTRKVLTSKVLTST